MAGDNTEAAVRAFVQALTLAPGLESRMRLVMIGDGPLRAQSGALLGLQLII